jgi:hypothetical protein
MSAPLDAGALGASGSLSPLPLPASPSRPAPAPRGGAHGDADGGTGGAGGWSAIAAFLGAVRRRRVVYDIAIAWIAADVCAAVVGGVAWLLTLALARAMSTATAMAIWPAPARIEAMAQWLSPTLITIITIAAAAIVGAVTLARRAPFWRDRALIDLVEAAQPACGNLLVTAHELTREPLPTPITPYIRARVLNDAVRVAQAVDLNAVLSWRAVGNVAGFAVISMSIGVVMLVRATTSALPAVYATQAQAAGAVGTTTRNGGGRSIGPPAIRHVTIDVIPPAYVGLPTTTVRDPERLEVLAGSRVRVRVEATADEVDLELDGLPAQKLTRGDGNRAGGSSAGVAAANSGSVDSASNSGSSGDAAFVHELTPVQSGVLAIGARTRDADRSGNARDSGDGDASADGSAAAAVVTASAPTSASQAVPSSDAASASAAHRLIALTLIADQPPVVTITAPGHDLMASDVEGRVRFVANATDDYGLRTLTLHYTKASGAGERFEFKEAEVPLTIARNSARQWEGAVEKSLRDLNVEVGDMIVYYAAATDNRPGQERGVSDTYVIEISQTGAAIAGGFAVPKDEDVFAISLNALIQKTEKLHGRRTTMPPHEFTEAAAGLAIEQRMVRSEFLFSMGTHGRVEDEEEEAENSNEIQEGRLHNKGQSELAQAVDLMTVAERHLTDANTGEALKAQRAALAAVQRAQSRLRYFLRTIPLPSRIDQTRRLTGNLTDAASSQHPAPSASPDERAAALRTLLNDCARLSAMLGSADGDAHGAPDLASAIGARLMALDPTSTPLHAAAASLLQAPPLAARGRVDEARTIVRSAAALVVPLAQRASAPASASAASDAAAGAGDAALRGAVVDALRRPARPGGQR